MVHMPTALEQRAFASMQARMIELLLRHDEANFRQFVGSYDAFAVEDNPTLARYRDLATVFHLRDELFEHILPRIVRRLSFAAPRTLVVEEPPARGQIDWDRTLAVTWDERPGEPPLTLITRQQRRDFAIPENLLTVVTLLEYHQLVEALLWDENLAVGAAALRHPLTEIVERCERELAFPQFAGLRTQAAQVVAGLHSAYPDGDSLAAQVSNTLIPGGNSAYQDLLAWRERLHSLQLLRRLPTAPESDVLGSNPTRDNYLYQLWIFYELADLLTEQHRLVADGSPRQAAKAGMRLRFRWGAPGNEVLYELRHDQAVPNPAAAWSITSTRDHVPDVRPDFYLTRLDPPMATVVHNDTHYWREPGVIWDAKYYRPFDTKKVPADPIKRMIADMALLGEEHGTLLFAFLTPDDQVKDNDADGFTAEASPVYTIAPEPGFSQNVMPSQTVRLRQLHPQIAVGETTVRDVLLDLLETAHAHLGQPREVACYAIFFDSLSATNRLPLLSRYGIAANELDEAVLCPKPHIGPWRMDLVHRGRDCCENGKVCQIIALPNKRKPIRPLRTAGDLLKELKHILAKADDLDDLALARIVQDVESLTRQFATINNIQWELYFNRVRDLGLRQTFDLLDRYAQESLALAIFLTDQLDTINSHDFSAPAIHIGSVMERLIKERIFAVSNLQGDLAKPHSHTMGKLTFMQQKPWVEQENWELIQNHVAQHWKADIEFNDMVYDFDFIKFVRHLNKVKDSRNNAAHVNPVSRTEYGAMQDLVCQTSPLGKGLLDVLLLAWS